MDLLDWHRGRLSSRRLAVLVRHMPRDSALARAVHGEAAEWAVTDHLLAAAVDHLAEANWMFATVNQDEDAEPLEYPTPVPRPSEPTGSDADADDDTDESGSDGPGPEELGRFFA
ncbi:hypothetical protein RND61_06445 [Streptomyces sp. TRM76323]|uniref:Uncharacterized protein n=1 Tax=Streptomyces tamarix TaxID=3078565 RepID=A0ABU3QG11_9ACTN|nr:hypothetical protein [Streptomyces tamarix]MDT9681713.1 hypothetical protein [Streptomyces tamarix]